MRARIRIQSLMIAAIALVAVIAMPRNAKADYVNDQANGVEYYDSMYCSVGNASKYAYGGSDINYIYLSNEGDTVSNVKSSSGNLIAKITSRYYSKRKEPTEDSTYDNPKSKITTTYGSTRISCFAKKKGKYTVTFDVVKADGTVRCTKTVKVSTSYPTTKPAIKSITYAGKDIYAWYPYTKVTSGKLSVKMNKGYTLKKIEVSTMGKDGKAVIKTVKNGKTIKLAKVEKYTSDNYSSRYEYNSLFPTTEIMVTYVNKKTKEEEKQYFTLYTMNKK